MKDDPAVFTTTLLPFDVHNETIACYSRLSRDHAKRQRWVRRRQSRRNFDNGLPTSHWLKVPNFLEDPPACPSSTSVDAKVGRFYRERNTSPLIFRISRDNSHEPEIDLVKFPLFEKCLHIYGTNGAYVDRFATRAARSKRTRRK